MKIKQVCIEVKVLGGVRQNRQSCMLVYKLKVLSFQHEDLNNIFCLLSCVHQNMISIFPLLVFFQY